MRSDALFALLAVFAPFSLVSIGGGTSIIAGIQHQAVDVHHWVTAREFVDFFAISRAAPGPGMMLATLIGWHVWGWVGAGIATLALFMPSSLLCFGVVRVWNRHRGKQWHSALEEGLSPIGTGLILAGIVSILQIGQGGVLSWVTAITLAWHPKIYPLLVLAAGAAIFIAVHAVTW